MEYKSVTQKVFLFIESMLPDAKNFNIRAFLGM
jgi:hypothetical protein